MVRCAVHQKDTEARRNSRQKPLIVVEVRVLKPSMRQVHRAGEKVFVDFFGTRPHLVDARTGEERAVELFVGVLGANGLIYAEAASLAIRLLDQAVPAGNLGDILETAISAYGKAMDRTG